MAAVPASIVSGGSKRPRPDRRDPDSGRRRAGWCRPARAVARTRSQLAGSAARTWFELGDAKARTVRAIRIMVRSPSSDAEGADERIGVPCLIDAAAAGFSVAAYRAGVDARAAAWPTCDGSWITTVYRRRRRRRLPRRSAARLLTPIDALVPRRCASLRGTRRTGRSARRGRSSSRLWAWSAVLAWRGAGRPPISAAAVLVLYGVNAVCHFLWSPLFFKLRRPDMGGRSRSSSSGLRCVAILVFARPMSVARDAG